MQRRAFLHGVGASAAVVLPGVAHARPLPPPDPEPDRRPLSADNPRIWPAISRASPLLLGAVDAFRSPDRAAEMGVQFGRIMFDWSAIQRKGPEEWSFGWSGE